jgi:hypothetical protein
MAVEVDAHEFGTHLRQGGWRLGLLVARNVERGRAGRPPENRGNHPDSGKVSAAEFARMAGLSDHKIVLRYLDAWDRYASEGKVKDSVSLSPEDELELDGQELGRFRLSVARPGQEKPHSWSATAESSITKAIARGEVSEGDIRRLASILDIIMRFLDEEDDEH